MTTPRIVVVGSYNRDIVLSVAHLPAPGETCLGLGRLESPGGKGSNQAIQAARCGAHVAMIAAVGADAVGDAALQTWREAGVDASGVARLADAGTGMAMILVDEAGENSIVVDSGANARLAPDHVRQAARLIDGAGLVLAQLETPLEATLEAFGLARAAGVRTVLNAAPAPHALDAAALALTDILVVNEIEGLALSGETEPEAIGARLLETVREAVIVTLGREGALLCRRGTLPHARGSHTVEVVDTTGAGDAFIGAFCAKLAAGEDAAEALRWGLAAGAIACCSKGAAASFGDAAQIGAMVAAAG
ncbi:MAG TPA: ribokinase [Caulobacteraceae bacterium]|jgi:ribokinase|nr:ribokinase [Caulobacteraceae bacterium]